MLKNGKIIVIDFGSQYLQLIAKSCRFLNINYEILPFTTDATKIIKKRPAGLILSGSPACVLDENSPKLPYELYKAQIPILAICYGMQVIAQQLGGKVRISDGGEFGNTKIKFTTGSFIFRKISSHSNEDLIFTAWMSHRDEVIRIPKGFTVTSSSEKSKVTSMEDVTRNFYALQFHPETSQTEAGKEIFRRFIIDICQCRDNFSYGNVITKKILKIKETIQKEKVILAVSGGLDSSVLAVILNMAIKKQLITILVDTGFLRLGEIAKIRENFVKLNIELIVIDAQEMFYQNLRNIKHPEEKRKIIGRLFIEIFQKQTEKYNVNWFAQGTIYSDVIESAKGSNHADLIKSHHNVGGLPENIGMRLIEPLADLFKDEVYKIAKLLKMDQSIIENHPFPGPGLAIRIIGKIKKRYINILRQADKIFIDELKRDNLYHKLSQAFALFLPIRSVGIKGDARRYNYVIALRAVESVDFMTAKWAELPHDFLSSVSSKITNEIEEISRVVYDISDKPPGTIEWE